MLSVSIMAHPNRKRFVKSLERKLPEAEVVWDQQNDRWSTGRRALLAFDPDASHQLVVQDDAVVCKDLVAGVERAAESAGERPLALYIGKTKMTRHAISPAVEHARQEGIRWLEMSGPLWGVAIAIPTAHIKALVEWGDRNPRIHNYDMRIAKWYFRQGISCWYTMPSLVDHRPVSENPSLIDGRTANRQAHWFIGRRSALSIDWDGPVLRVDDSAASRRKRTVVGGRTYEYDADGVRRLIAA